MQRHVASVFTKTESPASLVGFASARSHTPAVRFAPCEPYGTGLALDDVMLLLGFRGFRRLNRRAFVSFGHLGLMAGIALVTATVVGGSGYLIRELHRQAGFASVIIGLPAPAAALPSLVPISSDMLKVSSIALGKDPVAIVNGTELSEGATMQVQTTNGIANLTVVSIRDGIVQFKYGDQTILANLR